MLTVYNRTFVTRNAQYSFARQLQVDLVLKVLRATDLYAAADFYACFLEEYTDEFMPDFENDYEDEDGEPCNAFRYKPEAVWDYLIEEVLDHLGYLDKILNPDR